MSAPNVLAYLSRIGVRLTREGDALVAKPRSALTEDARVMIRAHRNELLAALSTDAGDGRLSDPSAEAEAVEDLREHFEERASILEFDAKLPRPDAEREAGKATFLLARAKGYSWAVLRSALPPELVRDLPDGAEPVDGAPPWGLPRWVVTPAGEPARQGVHTATVEPLQ